jgi:ubiquinone/menaquinone biosynthesis C-methylase UbiE
MLSERIVKPESERLPVDTSGFWRTRIFTAIATGKDLHTIIYNTGYDDWRRIQGETTGILKRHIRPGQKVLDAGCAYGPVYECIRRKEDYWGIDISPDLIELAKIRHPDVRFEVGDLCMMPQFPDKFFDFVVCRSVEDMIKDNLSDSRWEGMLKELKRVGKQVMLMEYTDPLQFKLLEQ